MAASPGNMYQKKALKTRQTAGFLQPSSGSMSKADRYLKADKDIPMNAQPPPSPTVDPSANMRKFSQITLRSDTSDDLHTDLNSNGAAVGTPKQTRAKRHLHQVRYGFLQTAQMLSSFPCEVLWWRCHDAFWKRDVLLTYVLACVISECFKKSPNIKRERYLEVNIPSATQGDISEN